MNKNNNYLTNYQPKLRFKEFSGAYENYICNQIAKIFGVGIDKVIKENEIKVKIVNFMDVFKNKFLNNDYNFNYSSCSINELNKFLLKKGDILITPSSENKEEIGITSTIMFTNKNVVYSYHLNLLRFNEDIVYPLWMSYYFDTNYVKKYFYSISSGITRYTLSKKDIENTRILIPKIISEQTKIANFLSLLDKQIDLYVRKLKLMELLSKYFNDFLYKSISSNKKILLSELISPRKIDPIKTTIGYTPISIMLNGNGFKKTNLNVVLSKKGRKYYERICGDIIIGLQNFHNGSIDILNDSFNKPIMSNAIASFINISNVPSNIIKQILLNKRHQYYLKSVAEGTGQKEFTIKKILSTKIYNPYIKKINLFDKLMSYLEKEKKLLIKKTSLLQEKKKFYLNKLFI